MADGQFISPEQWSGIKDTIGILNTAEANGGTDLADWFFDLRDHLQALMVATSEPVQPFEVSEHFCYLLDMYVAGSELQSDVGGGSQLVINWARQTLASAAAMDIAPIKNGDRSIWLVVHPVEGNPE